MPKDVWQTKGKQPGSRRNKKKIIDRCFDSGVKRKSARYTPAQCQKEMERQIGPDNALKESQILVDAMQNCQRRSDKS